MTEFEKAVQNFVTLFKEFLSSKEEITKEVNGIILLAPPSYKRTWDACREFEYMTGELELLEKIDQQQVDEWLNRIANATKDILQF